MGRSHSVPSSRRGQLGPRLKHPRPSLPQPAALEEPGEPRMTTSKLTPAIESGDFGQPRTDPNAGTISTPFTLKQLERIDEALTMASRETGINFSLYVGRLAGDTRGTAEGMHPQMGANAANGVLVAVDPGQRVLEIVTGRDSVKRLPDRSCALAALSMTAAFGSGDLVGGIVNGLRMLSDQAGHPRPRR